MRDHQTSARFSEKLFILTISTISAVFDIIGIHLDVAYPLIIHSIDTQLTHSMLFMFIPIHGELQLTAQVEGSGQECQET